MTYKKLIMQFICVAFTLTGLTANAQIAILQNTIDKIGGFKNFSYQYVYKQKEVFNDTLFNNGTFALLKMPDDKKAGYFFRHDYIQSGMKNTVVDVYNRKNLSLNFADSTFFIRNIQVTFPEPLIAGLNWLKNFGIKNPAKITQVNDTTVHSTNSYHLVFNTRDTTINKDHLYTRIHLLIDKVTGLPLEKFIRAKTDSYGKEATDYYTQESYFNYKIDQDNINTAYFDVPTGFHLEIPKEKPKEATALLTPGTPAPDWTLYDTDGKKTSLSQLKGKIVLLDFFFVGCVPCMHALAPLERLDEKYKNKNFLLLSISDRDNNKLVTAFKNAQHIKNKMYPDGARVASLYYITAAPTFYIIDKEGKIANVMSGVPNDFEKQLSAIIDNLIKRS